MTRRVMKALEKGWIRPVGRGASWEGFVKRLEGPAHFACVIASTETAAIEGISAAGETPEKRRYTAALDAEYLVHGKTLTLSDVPRNPLGPPSPVLITRAALQMIDAAPMIVDAGTAIPPRTPRLTIGATPGASIRGGNALVLAADFPDQCRAAARMIAKDAGWLILAESVPGGTTTAQALLEALGVSAKGKTSSSMPGGNHSLKEEVVAEALAAAKLGPNPAGLTAAAAVGDPMQPAVALMALQASLTRPVLLGGGTQMAAVWALIVRLHSEGEPGDLTNIGLATTKWVAADQSADLAGILDQIPVEIAAFASWLDFSKCENPGLQRYEEGLVKEGVGAGAAAFAALAAGETSLEKLAGEIDKLAKKLDGKG